MGGEAGVGLGDALNWQSALIPQELFVVLSRKGGRDVA